MDSTSSNVFAKLGWTIAEGHRLQLMANRYELRGLDNYLAINGDYRTGRPTISRCRPARWPLPGAGLRGRFRRPLWRQPVGPVGQHWRQRCLGPDPERIGQARLQADPELDPHRRHHAGRDPGPGRPA
ncbi:hypothetical protein G6F24_017447 [Rhizopus arrhizus]|nr:hypothetical protein G6F24_017447 [Rhizopus arrhizus]